jgi:tetratricopeptide (TPR) repeat protein
VRPHFSRGSKPGEVVDALNHLLVEQLAIRPSMDLHDPCNLLPTAVLERKQGYCVGVAAIYLALAQELNLPMYAVATPSHVFLRYDDGVTEINVDTTQIGISMSDDAYAREARIPEKSIRKGIFMKNLSEDGFLAQVHNNLGVIYSEKGDYVSAAKQYREALELDRHVPAAWYNWGNDLLVSGDYPGAARAFTRSLDLYPTDVWSFNNRGISNWKRGKVEKARRDFETALRIDPGFDQAKSNLKALAAGPASPAPPTTPAGNEHF